MTPEEEAAYEACQKLIAEAKADGRERLETNFDGYAHLTRIPPEISELEDLTYAEFQSTQITDLSPLAGLSGLQVLNLRNTQVSDLSGLKELSGLQALDLDNTQVSDLSDLKGLSGLQELDLTNTRVSDLFDLKGLSGLQGLYLDNTQVSDLSDLKGLSGLQVLRLDNTQVSDLSDLKELSGLQDLYLDNTQVSDLSDLKGLSGLRVLRLANTPLLNDEPSLQEIYDTDVDGAELVQKILEWQRENGKLPPKETVPESEEPESSGWSIADITQDPGGWRFDIPASLASLVVDTHSDAAPDAAGKLLPRVVARVSEAETIFAEGEDDPVPLIRADLSEMATLVAGSMEEIAAEALVLWELSVGLAHYLDQDTATVAARSNMPTLSSTQRGALTRLITTIAGFIRMFPDVAVMDDSLASWARTAHDRHLPPVMIGLARERQVLEENSAALVLRLAELAQNIGQQGVDTTAQMDKADAVTVKGQFNLLGVVAAAASFAAKGLMLGMLADAGAEISKEYQFGIHAAHFLRDAQGEVLEFVEHGPAYLKTALEAAISDVTDPDLPPLPPVKPPADMPMPPVKP